MNDNTPENPESIYTMDEMTFQQKVLLGVALVVFLYAGYKGAKWLMSSPEASAAAIATETIASNSTRMTSAGIASLLNH